MGKTAEPVIDILRPGCYSVGELAVTREQSRFQKCR